MKRYLIAFLTILAGFNAAAQTKGLKIGYIDMEYILEKSPDFAEAKNQLDLKAGKWKQEMDAKRNEINKQKESLQAEKALLTKELIEEREEEIQYLEKDLSDYQQQKFGPSGELVSQKSVLVKPIQDQIFTIVQDIATSRKYDFIFDKASDLTMLFAAKKYDLSDLIVKRLARAAKTEKLSNNELKKLEEQEKQEDLENDPDYAARKEAKDAKKEEREKKLEERKAAQDAKRKEIEDKREKAKQDRDAKRSGNAATPATTTPPASGNATTSTTDGDDEAPATTAPTAAQEKAAAAKAEREQAIQAAKEERERKLEERKEAAAARKKKMEDEREAAKKAREDKKNGTAGETTTPAQGTEGDSPTQPDPNGGK